MISRVTESDRDPNKSFCVAPVLVISNDFVVSFLNLIIIITFSINNTLP